MQRATNSHLQDFVLGRRFWEVDAVGDDAYLLTSLLLAPNVGLGVLPLSYQHHCQTGCLDQAGDVWQHDA